MSRNRHLNPWTHADVAKVYIERGCELLSKEYKSTNRKLTYRCSNGHEHSLRFDHFLAGHGCPKCRSNNRWEGNRIDLDSVKNEVIATGYELLFVERTSSKIRIGYQCQCGMASETSYQHFKEGKGCRRCAFLALRGPGNPRFNADLSDEDRKQGRKYPEYQEWRTSVFERDGYSCSTCGKNGYLVAHHLRSFHADEELRTEISNGVTLCVECHLAFHKAFGFSNNTPEQFILFSGTITWA